MRNNLSNIIVLQTGTDSKKDFPDVNREELYHFKLKTFLSKITLIANIENKHKKLL